jgi:hypothetical protein
LSRLFRYENRDKTDCRAGIGAREAACHQDGGSLIALNGGKEIINMGGSIIIPRAPKLCSRLAMAVVALLSLVATAAAQEAAPVCNRTIKATVVAFDQVIFYNRFGAFDPAGMIYALERDVRPINGTTISPGNVRLRSDKRPRPIVLRANEGDCLQVTFKNMLTPTRAGVDNIPLPPNTPARRPYFDVPPFLIPKVTDPPFDCETIKIDIQADGSVHVKAPDDNCVMQTIDDGTIKPSSDDSPATRYASMHVNGLDYRSGIGDDGSNVGNNLSSLVAPGGSRVYNWYAGKEGQYFLYSTAATSGGEGDGGQIGHGLFGAINVEPRGSVWYRSQVTASDLHTAKTGTNPDGTPIIDYNKTYPNTTTPVLNMLGPGNEIFYSDINAIITNPTGRLNENCATATPSSTCGQPFREFTVIFHDELESGKPAFPELHQPLFQGVRDAFGINYGASGAGSIVLANRKKVGPAADCDECKFEEFFLTSWANGDPAMLVKYDAGNTDQLIATAALYPDDPSNVHHSYLSDPVRFRNIHAGPKETHVFHLHAHQWVQSSRDPKSTYLDSQTISPGAAFTYEINYGGSGNRNLTAGDAIFHCHLYPHFAQGMWELWRVHDVFESGTQDRNLPDFEIAGGTPTPAVVPIPHLFYRNSVGQVTAAVGMPPMPTPQFKGYPFYMGVKSTDNLSQIAGRRPPQPPLDFAKEGATFLDGGLRRHRILKASVIDGAAAILPGFAADPVHQRVRSLNGDPNLVALARELEEANAEFIPNDGTDLEKIAMRFHSGIKPDGTVGANFLTQYSWVAKAFNAFTPGGAQAKFIVNGLPEKTGAPYSDPCIATAPLRGYRGAYVQFKMQVNRAGWHDRQARIAVLEEDIQSTLASAYPNPIPSWPRPPEPLFFRAKSGECITFEATNLVPNVLNLDDFQVFTPTDTIGQHIHLVKFDVTSSDGSGNGWNYEDGTFSPGEVQERIRAIRKYNGCVGRDSGDKQDGTDICPVAVAHPRIGLGDGADLDGNGLPDWIGAQTTVQRWWADEQLNGNGTLRTVFTHDHFGPSSHQHHGLYAGLIVEPANTTWTTVDGNTILGDPSTRKDGGPTSYAANILDGANSFREYAMQIADFGIVYTPDLIPVNSPNHKEKPLPLAIGFPVDHDPSQEPRPESISAADPGTQLVNYRHEPIPLRIGEKVNGQFVQKTGPAGNLAYVFSSVVHGDPFTPLLKVYVGDRFQIRLLQGAQEEQHVANIHGHRWLFEPSAVNSGYTNSQALGISEHFEFEISDKVQPIFVRRGVADYLYQSAATENLWDGQWGLIRAFKFPQPDLKQLPNNNRLNIPGGNAATQPALPPNPLAEPTLAVEGDSGIDDGMPIEKDDADAVPDPTAISADIDGATKGTESLAPGAFAFQGGINRCPSIPGMPIKRFTVEAWLAKDLFFGLPNAAKGIIYNQRFGFHDPAGIVFINALDRTAIRQNPSKLEPLMLRVNAGDCVEVTLRNHMRPTLPEYDSWNLMPPIVPKFNFNQVQTSNRVSLHPQLLGYDVSGSDGSAVGFNPDTTVGPGKSIRYAWYAGKITFNDNGATPLEPDEILLPGGVRLTPIEFGITHLRDVGDVIKHASHGAIGALIVEPRTASGYTDPESFSLVPVNSGSRADIRASDGSVMFREFALLYQDDLTMKDALGRAMRNYDDSDDAEDSAQKAFNYRMEPLWARLGFPPETDLGTLNAQDYKNTLSSTAFNPGCGGACGDPATPVFKVQAGRPVRFRIADVAGHGRQHGFTIFGHHWQYEPWTNKSRVQGSNPGSFEVGSYSHVGATRHLNILLPKAGGLFGIKGDFLYRTQDSFNFSGGLWGIFRVE